jgi:hypothetical protein
VTTNVPLDEFVSVTLDVTGSGTARLGPAAHGVAWNPTVASIKMTGAVPTGLATVTVFAGDDTSAGNFVDSTYDVNNAATDAIAGNVLRLGSYVFAVWAGGNAGATATLSVTGTKDIP